MMRTNERCVRQKSFALFSFLVFCAASAASAQVPQPVPGLETVLRPGSAVWITDARGDEQKIRVVGVVGDTVTAAADKNTRQFRTADIMRVRVRESDSIINGGLIGAGVGVASGLLMCNLTEPWSNCIDDIGAMAGVAAIGAGVGIGVDALIRGRRTVFEVRPQSMRLQVAPIAGRRSRGLQVSLNF